MSNLVEKKAVIDLAHFEAGRWCVENQKTGKHLIGDQFLNLTTPQRNMLERYVHHVEDQQP